MILAHALAVLLAAQVAPTAGATPTAAVPAPATATAAATPAAVAPDDPVADATQLRQMYDDSCSARAYGSYDDICDQLHQQVRAAERRAARALRAARDHPRPAATRP